MSDVSHTVTLAASAHCTQFGMSLADPFSITLQTILLYTQVQHQQGTGGSHVEKSAETQAST